MKNFTSRITAWFFLFAFLLNINYSQADAWVKHRSKCRWYRKEWKTRAWVDYLRNNGPHINTEFRCNQRDKGCDRAESDCYWNDDTRTRAYAIGGDKVRIDLDGPGPFSAEIYDYTFADYEIVNGCNGGISIGGSGDCHGNNAAGFSRILLPADHTAYHITKPFLNGPIKNSRGHISLTDSKPIYDEVNHTVVIRNLKGILEMHAQDIANDFAAFTISVTYEPRSYVESEDPYSEELEYMENLVWSSSAMLNNGRVLMDGALEPASFNITKNDGQRSEVSVELNIDELIIPIPEDISLEDISVNFGVDGGNLGYGISDKFMVKDPKHELVINPFFVPEEVFIFENYPNAVSDMLNIKVELPSTQEATIALMDINGNVIKQIYQGRIGAEQEVIIRENLDDLDNGLYFLSMWLKGQMLVRKVLVRH